MKSLLIVGFSLTKQYKSDSYKEFLSNFDNLYLTFPYQYYWKYNFFLRIKSIYRKFSNYFSSLSFEEDWVNFNNLKRYSYFSNVINLKPQSHHSLKYFKQSYQITKKISLSMNSDIFSLNINNIECSAFMLDSLQRFIPFFKIFKINSPIIFISTWVYIYNVIIYIRWLDKFISKNKIDFVLVNHQFYMESGFISSYLKEKYNSKTYHFSVKNILPMLVDPRKKWFKKILDEQLESSLNNKININKINTDIWKQEKALFNLGDCSKKFFDKNTIVIVMHCFADANSLHIENGVIFGSYFQWIRETISIARSNKNINYIFRSHPDSFSRYKSDIKIINFLFSGLNEKNIKLEYPNNYSQLIFDTKIPLFVTAKGNFSQELAIAGIKCITLDDSSAPNFCCKKINDKNHYVSWLSGQGDYESLRLSEKERLAAKLNKFLYYNLNYNN